MKNALIVEDHEDTREWLSGLLDEAFPGIAIGQAATLKQGVALSDTESFNLALVDISLPDGSGIALLERLSRSAPETYLIVTTIFDDDKHLFAALQAGAQGYLLKDQPRQRIIAQLAAVMRGEPPLSPGIARRILRFFTQQQAEGTPTAVEEGVRLTARETDVLRLLAKGCNRNEIATALGISSNTAAGYIKTIYQKLNVSGRAEAALEAARMGLVGG
ncbi:MAG: response regulator [Pseudomonadota bacterium]